MQPEQWHRIAERRKRTREKRSRQRAPKRLLAGLVFCEDCGRKAYYTAGGGRSRVGTAVPELTRSWSVMREESGAVRAEDYVTHAFLDAPATTLAGTRNIAHCRASVGTS